MNPWQRIEIFVKYAAIVTVVIGGVLALVVL
jgi:hypothetical protein